MGLDHRGNGLPAAAASFHGGGLYTDAPTSLHTLLPRVKAHVYFGHAIEDRSMPQEAIEKLDRALACGVEILRAKITKRTTVEPFPTIPHTRNTKPRAPTKS
jgi:dienelactone hydrolase